MSKHGFTRSKPDGTAEEMIAILLNGETTDFHSLFATVHENLRARGPFSGGEEMLRLRVYEKLQALASQGLVEKSGKSYTPVVAALTRRAADLLKARTEHLERVAARRLPG